MDHSRSRATREDKVLLVFVPHRANLPALSEKQVGDWIVEPGRKPVYPGQTVTWKTVPAAELELFLPDVFENLTTSATGEASATVKSDAPSGLFLYEAFCNGQLATGGSSPSVIIDP